MPFDLRGVCPLLQVFDMPTSLGFYRDILGFEILEAAPSRDQVEGDQFGWVWLRCGGADLMLNSAYEPGGVRPERADPHRVAAHDDVALFIGVPEIDDVYLQLRDRGFKLEPPHLAAYGMKQLYLKDPDGFTICFQWSATSDPDVVT